jgi:Ca-activated chloride channel homolog
MLEKLADKGNGNYAYIDTFAEAHKVLFEQAGSTLVTIAKDVKIQIEFNPRKVEAFRLIGYENRVLAHQDFNDDKKDAGEIGSDHTVTALYEIVPAGSAVPGAQTDTLKYQQPGSPSEASGSDEIATVKLRYKLPESQTSEAFELVVRDGGGDGTTRSSDFRFAAAVAELGMLLRESPHKGQASYDQVIELASSAASDERRREFVEIAKAAKRLSAR